MILSQVSTVGEVASGDPHAPGPVLVWSRITRRHHGAVLSGYQEGILTKHKVQNTKYNIVA